MSDLKKTRKYLEGIRDYFRKSAEEYLVKEREVNKLLEEIAEALNSSPKPVAWK